MYVLADGDKVTVVDCGVWRPDLPDGGLAVDGGRTGGCRLRAGRRLPGDRHPRPHRPLRAGRPGDGADRCRPVDARDDRPGLREVPPPDTARARRQDTYADHGIPEDERGDLAEHLTRWLPYLYSVVEASTRLRGTETLEIGGDSWEVIHTPGHSLGHICLYSPAKGLLLSGDHLLPGITPPVTFERGFDADPMRSYMESLRIIRDRRPELVYPGHGSPFGDAVGRIEAIMRNKARRLDKIRKAIQSRAVHGRRADRQAGRGRHPGPPTAARDQRNPRPHRVSAVLGAGRTADPAGRCLRVVQHQRRAPGSRRNDPALSSGDGRSPGPARALRQPGSNHSH